MLKGRLTNPGYYYMSNFVLDTTVDQLIDIPLRTGSSYLFKTTCLLFYNELIYLPKFVRPSSIKMHKFVVLKDTTQPLLSGPMVISTLTHYSYVCLLKFNDF